MSLKGKNGEGSPRRKDLRGSWTFSLKMQINGKEKSAVWLDLCLNRCIRGMVMDNMVSVLGE